MGDSSGRACGADRGGSGRPAGACSFEERVERYVLENSLIGEGGAVLVGLSGGADSVALTRVLVRLAPAHGWRIFAAHFNHRIRGESADGDERFCIGLCEKLGVPLSRGSADVPAYARENGLSVETAARILRYEFLERAADEAGAEVIAAAHHMDDNAESVMLHLIRGSGLAGLTGIKPKRGRLIRPLLCVRRAEIEEYLLSCGLSFRTDETNLVADGSRNRVRLDLIPYIEGHLNPGFTGALCSMAGLLTKDEEYLAAEAERKLDEAAREGGYLRAELAKLPYPIKTRAVRLAIERSGVLTDIERVHVEAVCALLGARTGAKVCFPHGEARTSYELILFGRAEEPEPFEQELLLGLIHTPAGDFEAERADAGCGFIKDPNTAYFDEEKLLKLGAPVIRTRREGDRIFPVGAPGGRKLKDFFIDRKVPRERRGSIPLVACGSEVLYVLGLTASELTKVDQNTAVMLRLKYLGGGADNKDKDSGGLA